MSQGETKGWGGANTGGAYTASPADAGTVSAGTASLTSAAPGGTATMTLSSVKTLDAVSHIDVALPALPTGSSKVYVTHFLRGTDATSYAVMLVAGSDGKSQLVLERIRNGVETKFATVAGPQLKAGQFITVALSAVGTNPVKLGTKTWAAGTTEPTAWAGLASDSATDRVTAAGPVGVSVYASKSGTVTPVRFDNLLTKSTTTAPANTPTPTPTPTVTPTPTITPTPTATPTPTTDPAGTQYPGQRLQAGAAAPGSQSYSVPATAKYVATSGSDSNTGTKASPFKTISAATKAAGAGSTVVVRGGVYHENVLVYPHDALTVEAYPGEAVWLDGSEPVSGWVKSGSVWVKNGWTTFFDASPTYTKGAPDSTEENWQWINPAYPMASHPDQIWVAGKALTQVSSRDAVTAGSFYADESSQQLVLGDDPSGKTVEASTLAQAMSVRSANSLIRGIGVRRYATSVPMMGTVSTFFPGVTFQDMTVADNAATGIFAGAADVTLKNVTVSNNGLLGLDANLADGLTVTSLKSVGNNSQHFNTAPVSGAMKITSSRNIAVTDSAFVNNSGQGPWFDESTYNVTFAHNDVAGNKGAGLVFELSDLLIAANNVFINNGDDAVAIMNSGNASIWNNTMAGNGGGIGITQDSRRASDLSLPGHDKRQALPDPTVPWIVRNLSIANNIVSQSRGEYILRVADWSREFTGAQMVSSSEGNLFHRASATSPAYVAVWSSQTGAATKGYPDWQTYRTATGRDASSLLVTGASPLTTRLRLTSQYASRASSALPISSAVAAAAPQLTVGAKLLGASAG
ncbi:MAG: right-handed parallel beta-helix repeat-containing protein [Acidipropionibacterium acidipropionici]|uniref:right-handed parallel beta-helix repeat-containing protein n=1 Tax=Acidipropionibacterium acidipropionici TaxID=1748 RepID=UPI002F34FF42